MASTQAPETAAVRPTAGDDAAPVVAADLAVHGSRAADASLVTLPLPPVSATPPDQAEARATLYRCYGDVARGGPDAMAATRTALVRPGPGTRMLLCHPGEAPERLPDDGYQWHGADATTLLDASPRADGGSHDGAHRVRMIVSARGTAAEQAPGRTVSRYRFVLVHPRLPSGATLELVQYAEGDATKLHAQAAASASASATASVTAAAATTDNGHDAAHATHGHDQCGSAPSAPSASGTDVPEMPMAAQQTTAMVHADEEMASVPSSSPATAAPAAAAQAAQALQPPEINTAVAASGRPTAPQEPPDLIARFFRMIEPGLRAKYPDAQDAQLFAHAVTAWQHLGEAERLEIQAAWSKDMLEYEKAMRAYEAEHAGSMPQSSTAEAQREPHAKELRMPSSLPYPPHQRPQEQQPVASAAAPAPHQYVPSGVPPIQPRWDATQAPRMGLQPRPGSAPQAPSPRMSPHSQPRALPPRLRPVRTLADVHSASGTATAATAADGGSALGCDRRIYTIRHAAAARYHRNHCFAAELFSPLRTEPDCSAFGRRACGSGSGGGPMQAPAHSPQPHALADTTTDPADMQRHLQELERDIAAGEQELALLHERTADASGSLSQWRRDSAAPDSALTAALQCSTPAELDAHLQQSVLGAAVAWVGRGQSRLRAVEPRAWHDLLASEAAARDGAK